MASYYHTVLARAYAAHPTLVADEPLFQTLLLALVARQKHVIVRTAEEAKVLTQTVNILHLLFSLSVVKLRLRRNDKLSPDDFLRLLFLENPVHGPPSSRTNSRKTLNTGGNHVSTFRRSSSYPNSSLADNTATELGPGDLLGDLEIFGAEYGVSSSIRSIRLHEHHVHALSRSHTDPTPLWHDDKSTEDPRTNLFPSVFVVSGLEYTSEEVQKTLWTIMTDRQVSIGHGHPGQKNTQKSLLFEGVWPLPIDFFVVYICPLGTGHDRPPIHKSLLDRFALSVEAYPHVENTVDNRMPPISLIEAETASLSAVLSPLELADLRALAGPSHTIIGCRAELYLSDLLSAVRHHSHLDGMLVTARCRAETLDLLRAWRALFGAPPEDRGPESPSVDVTDEDVRKAFVKVMQHRVSVLEGPRHEILASLIFNPVGDPGEEEWEFGRRTVKEVLKEILETV
ncbi:uncharacterized protein FOMMEDRAFT_134158 [Fomitiporia mediterranea MF3/22]|uniref:uncharacterized protein n=1 Tax=Fomitiporia mediterranea (strain MF3/22) TaxID=694068 RepID=UPI0004407EE1|nr:uncharacterized protein FOMMEDRAFT_134158 [Fomitiporia mediterranea MF3/22]EJD03011.1 hypothetical protein FOMMEDRAFT_134158 [Fomitiporia mediterranea MF3/22]